MKIKKFNHFINESIDSKKFKNEILVELIQKLSSKGDLSNLYFGNNLTPSVSFLYNNHIFSISLTDKIGNKYSTISVICEENGITELFGYYKINEIDKIVELISNYRI